MRPLQADWVVLARGDSGWATALGRLQAMLAVAFAGAQRLTAPAVTKRVAASSRARQVLGALADARTTSTVAVRERTGLSSSAISHTMRTLVRDGLVTREQSGKDAYWTITPLGRSALETAGGRPRRPAVAPDTPYNIVEATTWDRFVFDAGALRIAGEHVRTAAARSRLLCMEMVVNRTEELATRLLSWDSLGRFAADDHIEFALAPLDSGKQTRMWERALVNVVREAHQTDVDLATFWPASPPAFDAYAVVRGKEGRNGIVLVEAKSQPNEFRVGKARVHEAQSRRRIEAAVKETGDRLGAKRRWSTASPFPDAVGRLALLSYLRELGIECWLFNLYFVSPGGAAPKVTEWWRTIEEVRDELAITEGHSLSDYVTHEFVELPEAALGSL
jgi:DNA-binding MarR family transcriptional regulator